MFEIEVFYIYKDSAKKPFRNCPDFSADQAAKPNDLALTIDSLMNLKLQLYCKKNIFEKKRYYLIPITSIRRLKAI